MHPNYVNIKIQRPKVVSYPYKPILCRRQQRKCVNRSEHFSCESVNLGEHIMVKCVNRSKHFLSAKISKKIGLTKHQPDYFNELWIPPLRESRPLFLSTDNTEILRPDGSKRPKVERTDFYFKGPAEIKEIAEIYMKQRLSAAKISFISFISAGPLYYLITTFLFPWTYNPLAVGFPSSFRPSSVYHAALALSVLSVISV